MVGAPLGSWLFCRWLALYAMSSFRGAWWKVSPGGTSNSQFFSRAFSGLATVAPEHHSCETALGLEKGCAEQVWHVSAKVRGQQEVKNNKLKEERLVADGWKMVNHDDKGSMLIWKVLTLLAKRLRRQRQVKEMAKTLQGRCRLCARPGRLNSNSSLGRRKPSYNGGLQKQQNKLYSSL